MNNQDGGLVEKLIFEAYKDKYIYNAKKFKKSIKSDYGFEPSSDLYRNIINYQIKKYGKQLSLDIRTYEINFKKYGNNKKRKNQIINETNYQRTNNMIERLNEIQKRQKDN